MSANTEGIAMVYSEHGDPLKKLRPVTFTIPEPNENQVLAQLLAAPINPSDLLQVEGTYPARPPKTKDLDPNTPSAVGGIEGAFKILKVGSGVTSCKPGDWVIPAKGASTWRSHIILEASDVLVISDHEGLTPLQVATVSVNPTTADLMFSQYGDLKPGDWFIQNGGNSGLGRIAIQLAKLKGFKSINVIRDRADAEDIKSELKELGADHVVTEKELADEGFPETVGKWTGGANPKIALDCIGGKITEPLANVLAPEGHLITYGSMTQQPLQIPGWLLIFKDIHVHGFWLTKWAMKTKGRNDLIVKLLDMIKQGKLKDVPFSTHKVDVSQSTPEKFAKAFYAAIDADNNRKGKQAVVLE